mmetsp:Transcript_21545/g.26393  ORF Transcript_21545/g.26393 Transcript_21545/m.26393 type:complete len:185 (+) Transcript_21545:210-764(+)
MDFESEKNGTSSIKLISKEGDEFLVSTEVAKMSKLVEQTLDDEDDDCDFDDYSEDDMKEIPLPNVKAAVLTKVLEYCTYFTEIEPMRPIQTPLKSSKTEEIVQKWYADFCCVDRVTLFELVTAANFMDIKPLLDLTCLAVAVMIKGKTADEIRKIFNMSNNFTAEEAVQVTEENKWCNESKIGP